MPDALLKKVGEENISLSLGFRNAREDHRFELLFDGGKFLLKNDDQILTSEFSGDWSQYRAVEMDTDVRAYFGNRLKALTGAGGRWEVFGLDEAITTDIKNDLDRMISKMRNFHQSLTGIMRAILLGYQASEVWWTIEDGKAWIVDWVMIPNRLTMFGPNGELYFRASVYDDYELLSEPFKYPVISYMDFEGNRYGRGLAESIYHFVWGKTEGFKAWYTYLNKYAHPTPWGKYPNGATASQQRNLALDLEAIANGQIVVSRDDVEINFLESDREASAEMFREFLAGVKNEIGKSIQGQGLTSGEQDRGTGAFASFKVGDEIFWRIVKDDAEYASRIVTLLGEWFVALNYGAEFIPNIKWVANIDEEELTLEDHSKMLENLSRAVPGLKVDEEWLRKTFKVPAPDDDSEGITIGTVAQPVQQFAEDDEKKKSRRASRSGPPSGEPSSHEPTVVRPRNSSASQRSGSKASVTNPRTLPVV